jgi:hypothetical protein
LSKLGGLSGQILIVQPFLGLPALRVLPTFSIAKVRRPGNATSTGILRKPISGIFHWQPSTVFCQKLGIPDEYPANSLSSISLEVRLLGAM